MYGRAMRHLKIETVSDEFGQYAIFIECPCGHTLRCYPATIAAFAGWDANLSDVVRRLRCSKCGEKKCTAKGMREVAPRGYKSY
jgi:hypothetical protein